MFGRNLLCNVCHVKTDRNVVTRVCAIRRQLEMIVGKETFDEKNVNIILRQCGGCGDLFHVNLHCQYGMACGTLEDIRRDVRINSEGLERLIVKASMVNAEKVREVLYCYMRGHFPQASCFTDRVIAYVSKNEFSL